MLTRVDCVCILFAQEDPNCIQVFQNALQLVPLTYLMITFTVKSNQKFLLRVNDTKRNRHVMHLSNIYFYLRWLMSHAVSMHSFLSVVLFIVTAYLYYCLLQLIVYYKWQQQNTTTNTYRMYQQQQQQHWLKNVIKISN